MKKLKFGFTVVEMITAMAIVGVTAAFVIPMTVKSFNKHQYGIILGKAVQQIITGNQNMIQLANMNNTDGQFTNELTNITEHDLYPEEGINVPIYDNLSDYVAPFWDALNEEGLPEAINIRPFTVDNENQNQGIDDFVTTINDVNSRNQIFKFNQGPASAVIVLSQNNQYHIYIDVTGLKNPPNTYGKDIFAFELLDDGTLRAFDNDDRGNGLRFTQQVVRDNFRITYY